MTSSHFCTAERQYRMPVPYGSQRTPTAQWTDHCRWLHHLWRSEGRGPYITHVTCGKIVDKGITDANNMGAAMAPAAYDTLSRLLPGHRAPARGLSTLIFTGDLGELGHAIVTGLLPAGRCGHGPHKFQDCGLLLYDREHQDMHAGASGCGCSASVLNGYLLRKMRRGQVEDHSLRPHRGAALPHLFWPGGVHPLQSPPRRAPERRPGVIGQPRHISAEILGGFRHISCEERALTLSVYRGKVFSIKGKGAGETISQTPLPVFVPRRGVTRGRRPW